MNPQVARAFTLIELITVLVLVMMLFCLVVACSDESAPATPEQRRQAHPKAPPPPPDFVLQARRDAQKQERNVKMRSIHSAMVMYANGNNSYYPGLSGSGKVMDVSVEGRLLILVKRNYIPAENLISPLESASMTAWTGGASLEPNQYSYALLQVPESGGRRSEWRDTSNKGAAMISDRNTGTSSAPASVYERARWRGSVAWNDNRVTFEESHRLSTQYEAHETVEDDLFASESNDDALMIWRGQ